MNTEQLKAATDIMVNWLSHPNELGKAPSKIECTETFVLHDMTYYIFKYKKGLLGKWLLGVCGGFEGDSLEACGHVFSKMEEYNEKTAKQDAIDIVEMIREYWMNQAKEVEENENSENKSKGQFLAFPILSSHAFDKSKFIQDMKNEWGIDVEEDREESDDKETLIFSVGEMIATVGLMPAPIPNNEAEHYAEANFLWKDAMNVAKSHKAHLVVAVIGAGTDDLERAELFVKVLDACCMQSNVTGIATNGSLYQPEKYRDYASVIKDGNFPILNVVWIGFYQNEETNKLCAYTYGMDIFGKKEIEIVDASLEEELSDVFGFIVNLAEYVLLNDVVFNDGETIGFSETDKHSITISEGEAVQGQSLKISYYPI